MKTHSKAGDTPFYFTEECGLALMMSARSGRKLAMEKDVWAEIVSGLRNGWQPDGRRDG